MMEPDRYRYVGFDLETAAITPEGARWQDHRPLGITVAALAGHKGNAAYYGQADDGTYALRMTQNEASGLVDTLIRARQAGRIIVTWNGLGFDWQVLAEESGRWEQCRELAWSSIDMMYHVFCVKGFPLGLKAAAEGMEVGTKTKGIDGAEAPAMWARGERRQVVEYCVQDAVLTYDLAIACQDQRMLNWTARSGRRNQLSLVDGWLTVGQARELPLPDTSWMTDPMRRSDFDGWLLAE